MVRLHRSRRALARLMVVASVAALLVIVTQPVPAGASHYRATQINWQRVSGNEVAFHATASWRCTFFFFGSTCSASVGDTFGSDPIDFGDGFTSSSTWTVTAVDVANDVISAEIEEHHTYASTGPYTVQISSCCRLSSFNGHINNGDGDILAETIVDLAATTANPVSAMAPIVDCPLNATCSFVVPAFDPDGQGLRWRFSTAAEAGAGFFDQPGPPDATNAASINATTGLYTWNTTGATLAASGSTFYSTQVMVENVVGTTVVTKTPVDFFIRLGSNSTNNAPVFQAPTPADGTNINATVGSPTTFSVTADDADAADTVTLNILGTPSGSTFTTSPANPASGSFSWTPGATGTFILTLTAQDDHGLGATPRSVTIVVGGTTDPPPTVDAGAPASGAEGSAISLDGSVTDNGSTTTAWTYAAGAGVDAGATCSFAAAGSVDTTITCTDDGSYTATLTADDGVNDPVADSTTVTVTNADPSVSISSPADLSIFPINTSIAVTAPFTDAGANDTHTCTVAWGDGSTTPGTVSSGSCSASHPYSGIGVFTVTVTVIDDDGGRDTASIGLVLTDRLSKVTGGGFVVQPRRSFGFVARRASDGTLSGQIQVRDRTRNRFHGSTVASLVVSGNTATWSGTGRWNGTGGYSFTATVADNRNGGSRKGSVADTIQVTITAPGGATVLTFSGSLRGGNIVVHG